MDLGLAGKKALVTAGSRGIGRAVVQRLVAEGMQVAICARNAEGVELACRELGPNGEVIGAAVDASDHPALAAWVQDYADRLSGWTWSCPTRARWAASRTARRGGGATSRST